MRQRYHKIGAFYYAKKYYLFFNIWFVVEKWKADKDYFCSKINRTIYYFTIE